MTPRQRGDSLRIAMIGQKGLPATFGGIEHHVEELGSRMVASGHEVTVFCRTNYGDGQRRQHRGMRLVELPTVGTKHLDAVVHSALATAVAMRGDFDIFHYHAIGPGALAVLPRLASRAKVVLTLHGLDDERAKWGRMAKAVLRTAGWISSRAPDAIIAVSRDLQRHYRDVRGRQTVYIPNGVCVREPGLSDLVLNRFGLTTGGYALFVGRLVPEKAPDLLVRAFRQVPGDHRLVLVGGSSFTNAYTEQLRGLAAADGRVVLTDYLFGAELGTLYRNAAVFVLPSLLEGLPLTLLEAASYGTPIVASAIPPHVEVLGESRPGGRLVAPGDEQQLARVLTEMLAYREGERRGATALRERVLQAYSWDDAAAATERVYQLALNGSGLRTPKAPPARNTYRVSRCRKVARP
jgi:glycosyltransferase involved in cell wall biosynthesis